MTAQSGKQGLEQILKESYEYSPLSKCLTITMDSDLWVVCPQLLEWLSKFDCYYIEAEYFLNIILNSYIVVWQKKI